MSGIIKNASTASLDNIERIPSVSSSESVYTGLILPSLLDIPDSPPLQEEDGEFCGEYDYGPGAFPKLGEICGEGEVCGERGDLQYQPSKSLTTYVSGLSRFAWMKSTQQVAERNTTLTDETIQRCLSKIGRAICAGEMAYLKFECRDRGLENIDALTKYPHVRNVDLSQNSLSNLTALAPMQHLQVLNVQENRLQTFGAIPQFIWLQALNISKNNMESLEGIHPNYLTYLNLSHNRISSSSYFIGEFFPNLLLLELRGNLFKNLAGFELSKLRHLYIAQNKLSNLDGIEGCPELELLHARDNRIRKFVNFPNLAKLKYLNLRTNYVSRFTQIIHLGNAERLETLVLKDNPIEESERYREEVLAAVLTLNRLDKNIVTEIEKVEGRSLHSGRVKGTLPPLEDDPNIMSPRRNYSEIFGEDGDNDGEEYEYGHVG